jgi:hypothetical protein
LFAAIDEVSAAARSARLFLESRVKARKQEIKDEIVQSGIRNVRALLEAQSDDFRLTDVRGFTDRGLFEDATKGKRGIDGIDGMDAAVGLLVDRLRLEISTKVTEVDGRAKKLARVAPEHMPLFQDRAALLDQSDEEFDATVARRIQVFEQQKAARTAAPETETAPKATTGNSKPAGDDLFSQAEPPAGESESSAPQARGFLLTLQLHATESQVEALMNEIREQYGNHAAVRNVKLEAE